MENIVALLIPAVLAVIVLKALLTPMKWALRAGIHGISGFLCLWLMNSAAAFTGLAVPINAVTVLLSGTLGIPGIALLALVEIL